jgi:hypothetical protein
MFLDYQLTGLFCGCIYMIIYACTYRFLGAFLTGTQYTVITTGKI